MTTQRARCFDLVQQARSQLAVLQAEAQSPNFTTSARRRVRPTPTYDAYWSGSRVPKTRPWRRPSTNSSSIYHDIFDRDNPAEHEHMDSSDALTIDPYHCAMHFREAQRAPPHTTPSQAFFQASSSWPPYQCAQHTPPTPATAYNPTPTASQHMPSPSTPPTQIGPAQCSPTQPYDPPTPSQPTPGFANPLSQELHRKAACQPSPATSP